MKEQSTLSQTSCFTFWAVMCILRPRCTAGLPKHCLCNPVFAACLTHSFPSAAMLFRLTEAPVPCTKPL